MICVQSISQKQDKSYIIYISKITQLKNIQNQNKNISNNKIKHKQCTFIVHACISALLEL